MGSAPCLSSIVKLILVEGNGPDGLEGVSVAEMGDFELEHERSQEDKERLVLTVNTRP